MQFCCPYLLIAAIYVGVKRAASWVAQQIKVADRKKKAKKKIEIAWLSLRGQFPRNLSNFLSTLYVR